MNLFEEKISKAEQTNQGADNPNYDSNLIRKRLMWLQQVTSKQKNYTKIFIGAYFVCSFLLLLLMSYIDNLKFKHIDTGINIYSSISILETFFVHKFMFCLVLPVFGIILYFLFAYKVYTAFGNLNVGQEGTARWTTREEIDSQYKKIPLKAEEFKGMGGLPIARKENELYIDDSNTNNLVIGTTRSGKGECLVNPMSEIISRAEEKCSMIFTDPKLELAFMQIPELEKRGYECHVLNLIDLEYSACFNPLKLIIDEYEFEIKNKNNDTSNAQQMCESVAYSLFPDNPSDPQPFFNIGSRDLFIAGVFACMEDSYNADIEENKLGEIFHNEDEYHNEIEWAKNRFGNKYKYYFLCKTIDKIYACEPVSIDDTRDLLYKLSYELSAGNFHEEAFIPSNNDVIDDVVKFYTKTYNAKKNGEFVNRYKKRAYKKTSNNVNKITIASVINLIVELNEKQKLDEYFSSRPEGNYAKIKYATVLSAGSKAKGDLISTFFSKVSTFMPTNIQRLTSKNSFSIMDIGFGEKPMAIFIGLPDYDQSKNFLASIFLDQVYMTLSKLASSMPDKKVPRRVHFILDEFGNLPALNDMGARIKLGLGRNLLYTLIVQDLASIHDVYKEEATAIISNCGNKVYIKAGDNDTNEEFSKLLGNETYTNINRSGRFLSLNKERTEIISGRPLLTAEELGKLKMGEMVIHRIMKRTDLNNKPITTYPIANIGDEYRMLYRYEYMPEIYNDKQLLYESLNINRIIEKYSKYELENFNIVEGYQMERTDNINLDKIKVNVADYYRWSIKKEQFIDFNQEFEDYIHSFILNLPESYLTREEKEILQELSKSQNDEEQHLAIMEEVTKLAEMNHIVRYKDVEFICKASIDDKMPLNFSTDFKAMKKIDFAKIYIELHRNKFYQLYRKIVEKNNRYKNDYDSDEIKVSEGIYEN